ncbi:MAG: DUF86 domain-containing protein [Caldilineaceae bacterium]|nr:DUF86 domain-containing protein [Caldilineaceae bacterium]
MSSRGWQERVQDILDAVTEINGFVDHLDLESFQRDTKTIRAVEMNFIIIGEAAASIPDAIVDSHPEVPWHLMRGMRNRLVHGYFTVDEQIMWDTVKTDLPPLAEALRAIED